VDGRRRTKRLLFREVFLDSVSSIYPGYEVGGFGSVIGGTLYGLVDPS
jgi:hypothetical protein